MPDAPVVKEGQWIVVGDKRNAVDGLVMNIGHGYIAVGYYQNNEKAIKEDVVWAEDHWKFKYSGPNGLHLHGSEEAAVKRGPPNVR